MPRFIIHVESDHSLEEHLFTISATTLEEAERMAIKVFESGPEVSVTRVRPEVIQLES